MAEGIHIEISNYGDASQLHVSYNANFLLLLQVAFPATPFSGVIILNGSIK
jgi:hypothetical protein